MRALHLTMVGLRNLYIALMFLPLWIWSALIRYNPGGWKWPAEHWDVLSVLVLLYGAFGLWYFAERAVIAHYAGKSTTGLTLCVWGIAITLFAECLGAVVARGSTTGWGSAVFAIGTLALPLILLWSLQIDAHLAEAEKKQQKEAPAASSQEIVIEEHQ